jgi:hypothetical protein
MTEIKDPLKYIRPELLRYALVMESILRKNDYKGGWRQPRAGTVYLFGKLTEETKELYEEIYCNHHPEAMYEAGDVGNCSMMLFDTVWNDSGDKTKEKFRKKLGISYKKVI